MNHPLHGVIPPLLTPLTPSGEVDHESLARLVDFLVEAGVDGLFALGSSGQVAYLTDAERDAVVATIVKAADHRIPVLAGAIDTIGARTIESARRMVDAGVDYVVATAPFYTLNSIAEVGDHFRMLADAIDVPVVAYDVPVRVHVKLFPETLVELGSEGAIVAVKDSSGDDVTLRRLIAANRAAGSPLAVLSGHEVVCDAALLMGVDGLVPGVGNICPREYVELCRLAAAGDWAGAVKVQARINELFEIVFAVTGLGGDAAGIGAFKLAAAELGIIAHPTMPRPLTPLPAEQEAAVREIARRWAK